MSDTPQPSRADSVRLATEAIERVLAEHGCAIVPSIGVKPVGTPVQGHLGEMMVVAGWAVVVVQ
jgi:hypothetical protein